ncbi:MAG: threonylcarbamoyl-AMP synthase [Longispora sp.]|nr:threonylcarbamoyl-AMP synthase [Longispora sp. (in: high G+C Gram-positive bacteria)]
MNATGSVDAAVAAIRRGELIVMPTDTVYGIAADPFSPHAVDRLLTAKGRGREKPSGVLIGSWTDLARITPPLSPAARALAEAFWPGALSLILPQVPELGWDLGETGGTVMVRMPAHPLALEVLHRCGPLAVSSANLHGEPAAATATEAAGPLGDRVAVYLEAGPVAGVASTILDLDLNVIRSGGVTTQQIDDLMRDLRA